MDMSSIMQQAQQFQQNMTRVQDELGRKQVTGSAGGGMVTVTANGKSEIMAVKVDPLMLGEKDVTMLQDLILSATNDALRKARELGKAEMGKLTGGLNLPGLSNLFG